MKTIIKTGMLLLSAYGVYQLVLESVYRTTLAVEPDKYKYTMEDTLL